MFELSLTILNMKKEECTAERVFEIHKTFPIEVSRQYSVEGFESVLHTQDQKWLFLHHEEGFVSDKEALPDVFFLPSDEGYDNLLWSEISLIQAELRIWFDSFIDGIIPFERLQETCSKIEPILFVSSKGENPWKPIMGVWGKTRTLLDFILMNEIIGTFYSGLGEQFQRIRICPECGNYFYAQDIRKIFCTQDCKGANFYRLKRKKQQK